ncbi:heme oxygenase [Sphingomonas guangdongensis]|uniref:Heme oxygenase n=1 Tax=Sphingomonas guangdongensis TaxID=1141890 RepID=A0A285QZ58_9SPHN|nr:biliverdin-producing heme oxygenase [Sphingomonas guangdongensis]SOB87225.1 heme oxygenase [Sphingomonas guangdongensis]
MSGVRQHARAALRAATADDHERVDAAFARFDLTDRRGYAAFLSAQAAAMLPIEAALDAAPVTPDWPLRRRAHLLRADLAALQTSVPPPLDPPPFAGEPALLGALYVIEGSRLGGAMLVRSVSPDLPRSFLAAHDSRLWRDLLDLLDRRLADEEQLAVAAAAARSVFALFERASARMECSA